MQFMEPKDREINTPYSVYGNAAANDCLEGIDAGHVCRLIIGEGERTFVADHVRLTDGRIAMASSKGDRSLFESTEAEFGYGVAKARAYVYLPFDYSLFATDLENPRFADAGIDPDEMVPISVAEPVTDGGTSPQTGPNGTCWKCENAAPGALAELSVGPLALTVAVCHDCDDELEEEFGADTEGSSQ